MQSENDKIKKLFSSKFEGFEPEVPLGIWDRIADKLPAEEIVSTRQQSNRRALYRKISIGIASAAAVFLCFILLLPNDSDVIDLSVNSSVEQPPVDIITEAKEAFAAKVSEEDKATEESLPKTNKLIALASRTQKYDRSSSSVSSNPDKPILPDVVDSNELDDAISSKQSSVDKLAEDTKNKNIEEEILRFANSGNSDLFVEGETTKKTNKKGFSFSLGGNTGLAKGYDDRTSTPNLFVVNTVAADGTYLKNKKQYIPVKMDHRQPISFGLIVSKDISPKVSIETGLVYTYLSSKAKADRTGDTKRYDSQIFHYFGIPLAVNYNFAEYHKAKFYLSGGGMIQKDLQGRLKGFQTQTVFEGKAESEFKEKIEQKNVQLSVSGKLGVTYPLYNKLHAYTTVGGAYYINAGNKYNTIYSDRKFQLDLNLGLKLNF